MHQLIEIRRLIEGYRYHPKPFTRLRLQSYIDKHPVAVHLASVEDTEFLHNHNFQINQKA